MKTLKSIILSVGVVALLGASALSAQNRATADIPFAFTVQNTTLPAGHYTISKTSITRDLMSIRNVEAHQAIMVLAPGAKSGYRRTGDKNVVVFYKAGDRYFLSEVKTDAVCGSVGAPKLDSELASKGSGQPMTAVIIPALSVR